MRLWVQLGTVEMFTARRRPSRTHLYSYTYMEVSWNTGTRKSSILKGFSIKTIHFHVPPFMEPPTYFPNISPLKRFFHGLGWGWCVRSHREDLWRISRGRGHRKMGWNQRLKEHTITRCYSAFWSKVYHQQYDWLMLMVSSQANWDHHSEFWWMQLKINETAIVTWECHQHSHLKSCIFPGDMTHDIIWYPPKISPESLLGLTLPFWFKKKKQDSLVWAWPPLTALSKVPFSNPESYVFDGKGDRHWPFREMAATRVSQHLNLGSLWMRVRGKTVQPVFSCNLQSIF